MENYFRRYEHVKSILMVGNLKRSKPRYCFIIPTYKRPLLLKRTLKSIFEQRNAPEYNIVVVDNDSTPNSETERYLKQLGQKKENLYYYKNEENIGLFGNWNRCYELSIGEYCCFLMDDDEVKPEYLHRVDSILKTANIDCLHVGVQELDEKNKEIPENNYLDRKYVNRPNHLEYISWKYFLFRGALPPCGICVKKEVIMSLGGYNEKYCPGDFEMDVRMVAKYKNVALLWERLCIGHSEDSISRKEALIRKSISDDLVLYKWAYNDVYHKNGKYDWIAEVRTWVDIENLSYKLEDLEYMELDVKYNRKIYKYIYRILYRIHRIYQTFF